MEDLSFDFLQENLLPHWPFLTTALVFTVIGQFTSKKLFTRERAYQKTENKWHQHFWWWGRETLSLHPILTGSLLGLIWQNPESADPSWALAASVGYFAGAGVASLFAWNILKSVLKSKGITLSLPGDSLRPPES